MAISRIEKDKKSNELIKGRLSLHERLNHSDDNINALPNSEITVNGIRAKVKIAISPKSCKVK